MKGSDSPAGETNDPATPEDLSDHDAHMEEVQRSFDERAENRSEPCQEEPADDHVVGRKHG